MTVPTQIYNFFLRSIRDADQNEGHQLLERFLAGPQNIWETIDAALNAIPSLWSVTDCPDEYLKYLKWIVGWTSELENITYDLSFDELRRLIAISGRLWKLRGTEDTIIDVLKFATGARCRYLNWFDYRWILDETILGEEHEGCDPWMIALPNPAPALGVISSEYISSLRIVDNGTLNRDLVANLLELMRAVGEYWEIFYLGFLDQFIIDGDTTQWRAPTPTATNVFSVSDGKLHLGVTAAGDESTETIVSWANWNQMVLGARIWCFPLGTAATFQIRVHYVDSDNYYALEVLPSSHASGPELRLIKVLAGTPSTLDSIVPEFPIYDEIWYYYRISVIESYFSLEFKVYIDSVELISVIDSASIIGTGNVGLFASNGEIEVDEVELFEYEDEPSLPFTTEWTVAGDATARTITLPLVSGYSYNCVVDWGDGTTPSLVTAYNDVNRIHTYSSDGTYNVGISGICQGWSFNDGGDKLKITDIIDYGSAPTFGGFKYLGGGFYGCANLKSLGPSNSIIPDDGLLDISSCFRGSGVSGQIPSNLIRQLTSATNLQFLLSGCSGLTGSIPTDFLRYVTSATNLSYLMYGCSGLTGSIPTDFLRYVTSVINLSSLMYGCSGLTGSIPTDFLRYVTSATNLSSLLRYCSGLTGSIPTDFLRYVTSVTNLSYLMYDCSGLTGSIPTDFLRYVTSVTNLSYLMYDCSGLTGSIPTDLLRYVTSATSLHFLLYGCSGLTGSIPTDLLRYVTSATSLNYLLRGCSGLTGSIPTDLLRYVTSATNINSLLYNCSGLTGSIPTDFLRYVTNAIYLQSLLRGCSGLTGSIPTDLLRYVTSATNLSYLLYGCSGLTGYDADLCRENVLCTDFSYMMYGCTAMQQRSDTFYRSGEESTRFLNQSPNFTSCFERDSFTGTQGTAPDLWNCSFGTGTPTTTGCWAGAGNSAASLTNYASIPAGWK